LGVVNIRAERAFHGFQVGFVAVARKLDAIGQSLRDIIDEPLSAVGIATADDEAFSSLLEFGQEPIQSAEVVWRKGNNSSVFALARHSALERLAYATRAKRSRCVDNRGPALRRQHSRHLQSKSE